MNRTFALFATVCLANVLTLNADDALRRRPAAAPSPAPSAPTAVEQGWLTDHALALQKARQEKRPLLISFTGSDWCPPCMFLEKEVFQSPRFKAYAAKNVVLLNVDFPRRTPPPEDVQKQREQIALKYGVDVFPTVVVLAPGGKPLGALGYVEGGPGPWIAELEKFTKKP